MSVERRDGRRADLEREGRQAGVRNVEPRAFPEEPEGAGDNGTFRENESVYLEQGAQPLGGERAGPAEAGATRYQLTGAELRPGPS
jgi:hypothetical protein